jgi:hypothetical protein
MKAATILERGPQLLAKEDPDVTKHCHLYNGHHFTGLRFATSVLFNVLESIYHRQVSCRMSNVRGERMSDAFSIVFQLPAALSDISAAVPAS